MIFGTKKLKSLGADLGSAVKGFRQSVTDKGEDKATDEAMGSTADETVHQKQTEEQQTAHQAETKEKV